MSMSKSDIRFISLMFGVVLGIALFCGLGAMMSSITYHDKAVAFEANIKKLDMASETLLSNGTMTILDKAKIQKGYAADFKDSLRTSLAGNSKEDRGAALMWIQAQHPNLSTELYRDLSSYIEGMRKDFTLSRKRVLDMCGAYEIAIKRTWSGYWMTPEFPTQNFKDENRCKVISDTQTREAFSTGVQQQIL